MLDTALAERRQAGFAAPALEADIGARAAEVEAVEDRLWALKESLWGKKDADAAGGVTAPDGAGGAAGPEAEPPPPAAS